MPTLQGRILDYLRAHSKGADDGELQLALGVGQHATVNIACRALAAAGRISRQQEPGRRILINRLSTVTALPSMVRDTIGLDAPRGRATGGSVEQFAAPVIQLSSDEDARRFAYAGECGMTENEVTEGIAIALEATGWKTEIRWGHDRGVDFVARQGSQEVLLEAKGEGSRAAMRVNYFLGALGELLQRMESPTPYYGLAFPVHRQFVGLIRRLPLWVRRRLKLRFYLVRRAQSGPIVVGCIPEPAEL